MRLFEIYTKDIVLKEFWGSLEETLISEVNGGLNNLLEKANTIVFEKFNINPTERKYFIGGSARLYLYPTLREAFNLSSDIGDLDIVIPDKQLWINAGLENEWNSGGIYRPTEDGSIEVFSVWDPSKAGDMYSNLKIRSSREILSDATNINGYYYMSLNDIMDYKTSLSREKELDVVELITKYRNSNTDRTSFLKKIIDIIGLTKTKQFLGIVNK